MRHVILALVAATALSSAAEAEVWASFGSAPQVIAGAGTSLATGTPVMAQQVFITSCASGAGITLPAKFPPGTPIYVHNQVTGNACLVYPPGSTSIIGAGGTAGAAYSLSAAPAAGQATTVVLTQTGPLQWYP